MADITPDAVREALDEAVYQMNRNLTDGVFVPTPAWRTITAALSDRAQTAEALAIVGGERDILLLAKDEVLTTNERLVEEAARYHDALEVARVYTEQRRMDDLGALGTHGVICHALRKYGSTEGSGS